jgi:signal transduction histidine kinase
LPEVWTTHWPDFDGVVWYRLRWEQPAPAEPVGLMLDYLNMAGAVYLNGSLLSRDDSLVEPLTHAWNTPQYWLLSAPMLRLGNNTLLIRVSGLAAYQPGLGPVAIGDPAAMFERYEDARWLRRDLPLFSLAVTTTLGVLFLSLWAMRRRESVYGWFGLMTIAWWCYGLNQVATGSWPFASTHAWERAVSIAFMAYCACFAVFISRFCERVYPRAERVLWWLAGAGTVLLVATPTTHIALARNIMALGPALVLLAACLLLLYTAWRSRRIDQHILALCVMVCLLAGIHDLLVFFGQLRSNLYLTVSSFQLLMCGMAVVLALRFVAGLRRIEGFNLELERKVEAARQELAATLHHQHKLEVANARLGERLNVAHDLHDGLGGTLVSNIATLEHTPDGIPSLRFLSILKELRDDLRIIIDTAASHQRGERALAELVAPLRHRLTRLFESHDIDCDWVISGLDRCYLGASQSVDVLRLLQEGLTNVLKHSQATRVQVALVAEGEWLQLRIVDNGLGFDTSLLDADLGAGMRSMKARASRLGGRVDIRSAPGDTVLSVWIPQHTGNSVAH